ncbi:unnamed protein product [Arabidopsis lyrata]|uniref:Uncharacterized protein n=1 Tax=Arabidopsis lyrata subsp. lyrata TaxID=81972 RepID=D7LVR4_ARALL|nr:uncharacterized protein LOC9314214 [Arabidopsis lyrata subsp. lyrata]EFH52670.1 hypothetical protein ARALYDRAFT_486174 [Arabidopsis lyrata subsp. lyrata]CAH8268922.1 unnamed protein product [Arabidopsis lyrata]|eukprot:XP_020881527.1 uncharacterized protein LOC9314214 [Arabidopsis lyrata subsp. lyrata]
MEDHHHLPENLKPFFHRATEAQERLARLEAALASTKTDIPDSKLVEENKQIQSKLEEANATVKQEQTKVKELTIENAKQKYRILHLVRALREADAKLEKLSK